MLFIQIEVIFQRQNKESGKIVRFGFDSLVVFKTSEQEGRLVIL